MKGSSAVEASVFNDSRHSTGKASITEISLNISNGKVFNSLNLKLLLAIIWLVLASSQFCSDGTNEQNKQHKLLKGQLLECEG